MCMIDDADRMEWGKVDRRKAKKIHLCEECFRQIMPGEFYNVLVGKSEGEFSASKYCDHCKAASQWLVNLCGGWITGALYADLKEHWDEDEGYRTDELRRILDGMGTKWQDTDGNLMPIPGVDGPEQEIRA